MMSDHWKRRAEKGKMSHKVLMRKGAEGDKESWLKTTERVRDKGIHFSLHAPSRIHTSSWAKEINFFKKNTFSRTSAVAMVTEHCEQCKNPLFVGEEQLREG